MQLAQFDVKIAFLNGNLTKDVYMTQPKGYEDGSGRVCKLQKALYGLKQSARCWNQKFVQCLRDFNLKTSEADPCVFTSDDDGERLILAIYIDNGLVASTYERKIDEILEHLAAKIEITVTPLSLFLGMEIKRFPDGSLFASQTRYAERVIERFRMEDAHTVAIPADQHQDLSLRDPKNDEKAINAPYKEAVGSLLYLAMVTRPDIAYAVKAVNQYAKSPNKQHWNAVKRIIKYIKGTIDYGIKFKRTESNLSLVAFSDADFAGDKQTRKSTSGLVIKLGDAPIVWSSQKQRSVALSTTESEYIAATQTTKELISQ
ncbi:integrase core domain protein [Lasius niger]|uniref:Integrase core domain protein n=1 Tax=Lasius niger TaxID=67767 RepID=A0A0J7K6T4_LASNI|nr:integrase core domain protein [Lasius niger]